MGFEELVASQPTDAPQSDETVMDNEVASAPEDNVDGLQEDTSTPQDEVDGGHEKAMNAMQKRIDKLTAKSKGFEEDMIKEKSRADTYETMNQEQKPQTIQDLDVNGLTSFIANAENDPDLEGHLPEARLELQRRLIDERISKFEDKQLAASAEQNSQAVTNNIIASLSGDRLDDHDGQYYANASSFLNDLSSDQYKGINVNQVLAVALAENEYLKGLAKGPSMSDRVENNRNRNDNNLQSNNRAANGNSSNDIEAFLKEAGPLRRSNQSGQGSLREALSKLNTVRGAGGE